MTDPVVVWTGEHAVIQFASDATRPWERRAKRAIDIIGATLALVVAAPIIAVLAIMIWLESAGSPFFAHERIGYRGQRFKCLKLRTMRNGAEDLLRRDPILYEEYRRNHFKIPEGRDPRTTTFGGFLRRTSLDELPQFWNVLRGDMSLVGPRPVVEDELAIYGRSADLLLSVRPGITGVWAVNGRHDVGYPERCELELSYVRSWSLPEDARLGMSTVKMIFWTHWRRLP